MFSALKKATSWAWAVWSTPVTSALHATKALSNTAKRVRPSPMALLMQKVAASLRVAILLASLPIKRLSFEYQKISTSKKWRHFFALESRPILHFDNGKLKKATRWVSPALVG